MHLYYSLTSPYARVVRVAVLEKGLADRVRMHVVDPWADDPELMRVSPLMRVPALLTDDRAVLTESLLIVHYLEQTVPEPALIPAARRSAILSRAGQAFGIIDAAVHTVLGRRFAGDEFDASPMGERRRRAIVNALEYLERSSPTEAAPVLNLSAIVTAVALDYLQLRFSDLVWTNTCPRLAAWREQLRDRPSLAETMPPAG